jgi:hypothetical protein
MDLGGRALLPRVHHQVSHRLFIKAFLRHHLLGLCVDLLYYIFVPVPYLQVVLTWFLISSITSDILNTPEAFHTSLLDLSSPHNHL